MFDAAIALVQDAEYERMRRHRMEEKEWVAALAAEGKLKPCPEHDAAPCEGGCWVSNETSEWIPASEVQPILEEAYQAGIRRSRTAQAPSHWPENLKAEWGRRNRRGEMIRDEAGSF